FRQVSQVNTTAAVNNGFAGGQAVTLAANSLSVGGINFAGSTDYTGHSSNMDTVTDNTGTARWDITSNNAATSANNHVLANISQISGNAAVANTSNSGLDVTLNDGNFQAAGITFAGSTNYTGT
ncbi:hypothetical protein CWC28_22250, partial [Pseudoalteromonas sp. S4492]|uniref:hypothetical protein n=1 Tax=Pseudoalteromonas sp. S4492 TaxID=579560 RepID=UPI0012795068